METYRMLVTFPVSFLTFSEIHVKTVARITDIPKPIITIDTQISTSIHNKTATQNNTAPEVRIQENAIITTDKLTYFTTAMPESRPVANAIQSTAVANDPFDLLHSNSVIAKVMRNPIILCSIIKYIANVRASIIVNTALMLVLKEYALRVVNIDFSVSVLIRDFLYTLPYLKSATKYKEPAKRQTPPDIEYGI